MILNQKTNHWFFIQDTLFLLLAQLPCFKYKLWYYSISSKNKSIKSAESPISSCSGCFEIKYFI